MVELNSVYYGQGIVGQSIGTTGTAIWKLTN